MNIENDRVDKENKQILNEMLTNSLAEKIINPY